MGIHKIRYSYNTIFSDVCKTRFNHLVTRLLFIVSLFESIIISILSNKRNSQPYAFSIVENILFFIAKSIVLYFISIFIVITRKNYLHIDSLGYSSFSTQLLGQIFQFKFVVYQILFTIGTLILALVMSDVNFIGSSSFTKLELVHFKQFVWLLIPLIYNLQHNVFDMDKLIFIFDRQFQLPQLIISNNLSFIFSRSFVMSIFIMIISHFLSFITLGSWLIGFKLCMKLFFLTFIILYHFELINLSFNAHMTMGCLHKGKPISSLSPTPMETLISGLQSKKPFTKLTAFQELAYRATSNDITLRLPIYNNANISTNHNDYGQDSNNFSDFSLGLNNGVKYNIWLVILNECFKVINDSNKRVANYLLALEQVNLFNQRSLFNHRDYILSGSKDDRGDIGKSRLERIKEDTEILFGNEPFNKSRYYDKNNNNNNNDRNNSSDQYFDIKNRYGGEKYRKSSRYFNDRNNNFTSVNSYDKYNESILTHDTKLTKMIRLFWVKLSNYFVTFFFPITKSNGNGKASSVSLSLFEIWYLSKERRADKLIPVPIYHAESIISIMGFLINGINESPKGNVVASVGDVLKILERSVGILGKYTDWKPEGLSKIASSSTSSTTSATEMENTSVFKEDVENTLDEQNINVISILYEFSISAFLEIVLKYNVLLNDVELDEDVVKLSKWVLSMCESTQ